jgi:glycosyltransferase involved in cell wall biosynthesis
MILATILARNEEDIIGYNITHHIREGVDAFIITDNGSTDKTKEIASSFQQVKLIIDEPEYNHNQTKWVTRMARIAYDYNPDWIIHLDCDEFWIGLKNLYNETCSYLHIPVYRHLTHDISKFVLDESMWKVAHKPNKDVMIANGNHFVYNVGEAKKTDYTQIHHYPIRSYTQFEKKVKQGGEALKKQPKRMILNVGTHWQRWYEIYLSGGLLDEYNRIIEEDNKLRSLGELKLY